MPPTSDPQARLKTAPGRVLFHVRHFVADSRRALPDPQGPFPSLVDATRPSMPALFTRLYTPVYIFALMLRFSVMDAAHLRLPSSIRLSTIRPQARQDRSHRILNDSLFDFKIIKHTLSTARSTFNIETNCGRSFDLASLRHRTMWLRFLRDSTPLVLKSLGIGALLAGSAPAPDLIVVQG
ncbi:hypothetical protein GGG16DRAFT_126733 [Schizophyllum commune]